MKKRETNSSLYFLDVRRDNEEWRNGKSFMRNICNTCICEPSENASKERGVEISPRLTVSFDGKRREREC